MHHLLYLVNFSCFIFIVLCSKGDNSQDYRFCLQRCSDKFDCLSTPSRHIPLNRRLLGWNCLDECKYDCMWEMTDKRSHEGQEVVQFHGKWPFVRIFGMQEPASVVFSVLNGWMHQRGLRRVQEELPSGYPMKSLYVCYAWVNMNAWFWSSVFHTKDTDWTEKLDYFSAGAAIFYGFYVCVVRLGNLRPLLPQGTITGEGLLKQQLRGHRRGKRWWAETILGMCILAYFVGHITYLTAGRFDYAYNIIACAAFGLGHNVLWLSWAICNLEAPHAKKILFCIFGITAAMALELFDFPPYFWLFDAHSLWHGATILLIPPWYDCLLLDYRWLMQKNIKLK